MDRGRELKPTSYDGYERIAFEHHAKEINDLTLRGEYVYTANGSAGFEVFDVANIDQKGFSRALRQRARFAARPADLCALEIRHLRRAAEHAAERSAARPAAGE